MGSNRNLREWEEVRVAQPCPPEQVWLGRQPQVGERGTIIHINEDPKSIARGTIYIVESLAFHGNCPADTVWLAEFSAQEWER